MPASGEGRVHLGDEIRALQARAQPLRDLVEIVELGREDEVVDVADHLVGVEILGAPIAGWRARYSAVAKSPSR